MDAWTHGCMDAWMDGRMDALMHGCMAAWMHAWMDGWMHGCMDAWTHGWMDGRTHWCMDAWVHGCMDGMCGIIVAIDGLDHPDEAIGIGGTSHDSDTTGAGQTDSGSAVAGLITAKKLRRTKEDDGRVRSQACRVGQGFCPQIEAKGLDVQGSDLRW